MGFGASILLMAAGAILRWAIDTDGVDGVDLRTVGLILLIVGVIGLLASMVFWSSWGGVGGGRRTRVVEERDGPL